MSQSQFLRYIERTHRYYSAIGYERYRYAEHTDVPFTRPRKPLAESRLALITTAAPYRPELDDQGPGAPYNAAAKFFRVYTTPFDPPPDLRISHLGYDRLHTTADDNATWLPIAALRHAEREGVVGEIAGNVIGIPTNRSRRVTVEQDAVDALVHCRRQQVDVALLVPT